MWQTIKRWWKYAAAAISGKAEEKADPKIQIEQAIEEAKKQHQLLTQQAAVVVGQQKELEIKLGRSLGEVEKLQGSARQALMMADEARAKDDAAKATEYESAAQAFAMKLVTEENTAKDLKQMYDQSVIAGEKARAAVEQNSMNLQKQLAERSKLLSQLESAKMQERLNTALGQMDELTPKGDVPTLAQVREKIDARYAKALGESEIRGDSVSAKMMEVEKAQLDAEAADRLSSLRASLGLAAPTSSIEVGDPEPVADDAEGPTS
jgi:phage shock protein A